ncbi:efflux RND transporter periplasmic adaptor subunit [Paracoccus thiocyanatus]|nr:efflux RND transporter periplasmic adaptor subunit [Paracoccus thiocyanatus]
MRRSRFFAAALGCVFIGPGLALSQQGDAERAAVPVLTVSALAPQTGTWPVSVAASGRLAARDEIVVAAEVGGQRLKALHAEAGSPVQRGALLAELDDADILNDIARQEAVLLSAQAALDLALANAERGRGLSGTGAISRQQKLEYDIAERRARADLQSAQATLASSRLDLERTRILAPDDAVVLDRAAVEGAVVAAGQELFRLIRAGRIDWQAELPAVRLGAVRPGTEAVVALPSGPVQGEVRQIEPAASAADARVVVHVALKPDAMPPDLKAGLFANGTFVTDRSPALHVPADAVLMRDGFSYAYVLAADGTAERRRVETGRRLGDRIEILSGLDKGARVIQAGGAFLSDGAAVRVVEEGAGQ